MHYCHLIAVETDKPRSAIVLAEDFLEDYGNGDVWDWYEVGGRWDGYLGGGNILRFSDNPDLFREKIADSLDSRNQKIRSLQEKFLGKEILPQDVPERGEFGFQINDHENYARVHTEENRKIFELFQKILRRNPYHILGQEPEQDNLLGYYLRKFGSLISDYYTSDSYFWDSVWGTGWTHNLMKRCTEEPEKQWIVVVDLHN